MKDDTKNLSLQFNTQFNEYSTSELNDVVVMNSIIAPKDISEDEVEQPPVDLVCAIDNSGSMQGEKLRYVKDTMAHIIKVLKPTDRFGIVSFSSNAQVRMQLTLMNEEGKKHASSIVKEIREDGCTNLCEGITTSISLVTGVEGPSPPPQNYQAPPRFTQRLKGLFTTSSPSQPKIVVSEQSSDSGDRIATILVLTDGHANQGITDVNSIIREISNMKEKSKKSFSVHTFGYGEDHDGSMLTKIANDNRGLYFFVSSNDAIAEAFGNCIGGLLSTVGTDLKCEVEALEGVTIKEILSGYPQEAIAEGKKYLIKLTDIQEEERRDILFKLKVDASDLDNFPVVRFTLNYKNLLKKSQESVPILGFLNRQATPKEDQTENALVAENLLRIKSTSVIENALAMARDGKVEEGRELLLQIQDEFEEANLPQAQKEYFSGFISESSAAIQDYNKFEKLGGRFITSAMQQRSAATGSSDIYATKKKKAMMSRFK